ncbi:GDSL-type esterase/lipase family protein [Brevundimonas sp.]|uniref:GDSL-type esterase/lipase family protein n=1 Tax=Brevundimonas sp. TaxID=1871086 RepID=UPI002D585FC0|nr:GDSL-type esterase/lipase family protein [Brevundimonas sp.]HYC67707.1 GDSL-type esterase/lipase family protein [Brevundimonas sp.]
MSGVRGASINPGLAWVMLAASLAATPVAAQTAYEPSPAPGPGTGVCPGGLCQADALNGLFEALAAMEAGARTEPVRIIQFGDSHTAGDRITGKLRADLQQRFGSGGRGLLPAGAPHDGYAPFQVQMETRGWTVERAPLRAVAGEETAAFGPGAVRARAVPGAELTLRLEPGAEAGRVGVCGWPRGPGEGLSIDVGDEAPWPVDLNGSDDNGPSCNRMDLFGPTSVVTLRGVGRGVTLDTVWTERLGPGVVVSSLGMTGATLADLASRDELMMDMVIGFLAPSLVVLAYGTNEGFDPALDPAAYERLLRVQVERMREFAPWEASILILGAPDALRNGVTDGCSADGLRAPPPTLAMVRDVQRRVAADMGVAFWDWHGRMGGDCSADRLALMAEPYMRGDRVHFTSAGADWIGGVLAGDLLAAYDGWKAGRARESAAAEGSAQ